MLITVYKSPIGSVSNSLFLVLHLVRITLVSSSHCDKRIAAKVKRKVSKMVVRPAMMFGLETMALTIRQEAEMIRFSLGVNRQN